MGMGRAGPVEGARALSFVVKGEIPPEADFAWLAKWYIPRRVKEANLAVCLKGKRRLLFLALDTYSADTQGE